ARRYEGSAHFSVYPLPEVWSLQWTRWLFVFEVRSGVFVAEREGELVNGILGNEVLGSLDCCGDRNCWNPRHCLVKLANVGFNHGSAGAVGRSRIHFATGIRPEV